jgi:hypothetical protein
LLTYRGRLGPRELGDGEVAQLVCGDSGGGPDVASALAVVAMMGGPPPSSSLTREAMIQWVDNVSSSGCGS